jgi:hypothetical protein
VKFLGFSRGISGLAAGICLLGHGLLASAQTPSSDPTSPIEFSARLIWRTDGKTSKAQLFVKGDRYRIEHQGGIPTDLGYASVTIIRLDRQKVWYIFSHRRLVLSVPMTQDYQLPFSVTLKGEIKRTLVGDAFAGGRPARLYEVVVVNQDGQQETYFEWVDAERDVLLKLLSQDRDWSVEYEHVVISKQPDYFFETPLGYRKIEAEEVPSQSG